MPQYSPLHVEIHGITGSGKTLISHIIAEHLKSLGYDVRAQDPELDKRMLLEGWEKNFQTGQTIIITEKVTEIREGVGTAVGSARLP